MSTAAAQTAAANAAQHATTALANIKFERIDLAMLEALENAPKGTLRWADKTDTIRQPPLPGAPKGAAPRMSSTLVFGLESTVNAWADEHYHLTVHPQPEQEVTFRNGQIKRYTPDDVIDRCTISRLEKMVGAGLIEHMGSPDEETAKQPMRDLQITEAGRKVLELWRDGKVSSVPFPDAEAPATADQDQAPAPRSDDRRSTRTARPPETPETDATGSNPTREPQPPSDPPQQRTEQPTPSGQAGRRSGGGGAPRG